MVDIGICAFGDDIRLKTNALGLELSLCVDHCLRDLTEMEISV